MKHILLFLLLPIILAACEGQSAQVTGETVNVEGGSYMNISPAELNAMLDEKDFVFINVHVPFDGNIQDTDLSIPYDQIGAPEYLSQLPADKNAKIVLYCRSGRMSEIAAKELISLGFTNIWNLDGGMVEWEQAGYELEK